MVKHFGGCAITVLRGQPETGKSITLKSSIALFGGFKSAYYVKGTNAFFLERSSESTLLFVVDDPNLKGAKGSTRANYLDIEELVVDLYNGAKTGNAVSGSKTPRSAPVIASNFDVKSKSRYSQHCSCMCHTQLKTVDTAYKQPCTVTLLFAIVILQHHYGTPKSNFH